VHVVATSRAGGDFGLSSASPSSSGKPEKIISYAKLDISSSSSISSFVQDFKKSHPRGLNVLINNAGINIDAEDSPECVERTVGVNYRGTSELSLALLPSLHASTTPARPSRIVTLSSVASSLRAYSPSIASKFRSVASAGTLPDLEALAQEYISASPSKLFAEPPRRPYAVSKALLNALTGILARENPEVLVNACCPGWIDTDMGGIVSARGTRPPKTPEEGAVVPLHLALGDVEGVTGRYWANESVRARGRPGVREW
jgi:carbonyl reductase 1